MRRLPLPETIMAGVVVVSLAVLLRASRTAGDLVEAEDGALRTIRLLDGSGPLPPDLRPLPGFPARARGGYGFVAYGADLRPVDVAVARGADGPTLVLAWPLAFGETGRRAFVLRPPGFVLGSENDARPITGEAVPSCPWPVVPALRGDPVDPEEGAPEGWEPVEEAGSGAK